MAEIKEATPRICVELKSLPTDERVKGDKWVYFSHDRLYLEVIRAGSSEIETVQCNATECLSLSVGDKLFLPLEWGDDDENFPPAMRVLLQSNDVEILEYKGEV